MKNLRYKTVMLITFFFCTLTITAQQRNVNWVHGLDGNASSWQHYNQIFDAERNLNSLRTTYNTDNGITNSANQVIGSMNTFYGNNNNGANNPQNMGIGHSMGGLMIRDADRITGSGTKKFGGYITVTSPNYGAPISNSLIDGSVENVAENACNKLADGPLAQLFSLPWGIVSNLATNVLCDKFIDNDLVQNLQGTPVTNADLRVGSSTINAINNYTDNTNPNIPRISIWAEENSPVHWRMFSSSVYNNDMTLVNNVNSARGIYNGFHVYNTSLGIACAVGGFWNPFCWGASGLYFYRASQWRKGRNWIDDSENIWSSLIKTTRREPETYWVNVWVPCAYPPLPELDDTQVKLPPDPDCGEWVWKQRTRYISVNYPSDGLLPQYTQELQGIPSGNRYKVSGANHLEVRNMSNSPQGDVTKERFDDIFDRGDWFHTN
ncbi:MAG: hypothetical protein PSN34_01840 [Urechidicola sp.]|nr:hypothetical protein [Urechidicola sp.]